MRVTVLLLSGLLAFTNAVALPGSGDASSSPAVLARDLEARAPNCPDIWTQVNVELNSLFLSGGKCTALARGAIRAIFHDCGSWDESQGLNGGCDGSLVVGVTPDVEIDRIENRGLQTIVGTLKDLSAKYNVTAADMTVFAGNAAIFLCPGGPKVRTYIGRKDSTNSAKAGGLPSPFDTPENLLALFKAKGLDAEALAALLGAHSTSTQSFVNTTLAGASQDSTPGEMDVNYYKQTHDFATTGTAPSGVFVFPSDSSISTSEASSVGRWFQGFIGDQDKWSKSFKKSMERMALFGNDKGSMSDCTDAIAKL
ncbi:versatile peroxidase VPL1 [Colletotrichum spaethianum]|uniref:Peroxidase n=1 Tax=Colletotrichum spaethianum TaxID=700344 RepID=A0AA37L6N1_9PEZI|nr:versatile peroxidase VPL1 [Colletotrichum spaethianum]GKT43016.1 versatile peroxidase VPL1 [Colletotrichum spaethianum]